MKTEGKVWVLFDSLKNKKTKPLSIVQAQMMLLTFKVRDLHHYYIWTPGWSEWQPLPQFLSSDQKYFVQAQPPEPLLRKEIRKENEVSLKRAEDSLGSEHRYTQIVPAEEDLKKIDYGYYYNEFRGDDLTLSGIPDKPSIEIFVSRSDLGSPKDRRVSPRHDFKIEAILVTKKGFSCRSHSRNISLSGTLLEDEVPKDFLHKPFEVILVNKFEKDPRKNRVHLTCRIIGDLGNPKRLMFIEQTDEISHKLKKLIDDYGRQQNNLKRSC